MIESLLKVKERPRMVFNSKRKIKNEQRVDKRTDVTFDPLLSLVSIESLEDRGPIYGLGIVHELFLVYLIYYIADNS